MQSLVLASASPQRRKLLEGLDLEFVVHPSDFDESSCTEAGPVQRSQILARKKAEVVQETHAGSFVIGCDTLVVSAGGDLLEKAPDAATARQAIEKLSGATCQVHSGLCVLGPDGTAHEGMSSSAVTFASLTDEQIDWWIATGLWKDRSGSFQIDGPGQLLISHIDGDWTSIVGLPVYLLGQLLEQAGYPLG